jgi:hypothetical protein
MKWLKHYSSSHNNLKFQSLLESFGWEGYGKWWVIVELVADQGQDYQIKAQKNWKSYLKKVFQNNDEQLQKLLDILADSNLISKISLKRGDLCIPQLCEYCDDYQKKLLTKSGQATDNVVLEEKRREEKRKEKKIEEDVCLELKKWNERQDNPLKDFKPENILNKHGAEKIKKLIKKYGGSDNGFSLMLKNLNG